MLIIGAMGFAKEVLEILYKKGHNDIVFYDDVNADAPNKLFNTFNVLKTSEAAQKYFETIDNRFVIGIGTPFLRNLVFDKFVKLGGKPTTIISPKSEIGSFDVSIGDGSVVTAGVVITNSIQIGKGVLINLNTTIGHDSIINDFVELCPSVNISGNTVIGHNTFLGTGAVVLPNITIGANCVIAAGSVVTQNIQDNKLVAGIPAVIKKDVNDNWTK